MATAETEGNIETCIDDAGSIVGVITGTLVGFISDRNVPLVMYAGQPGSAAIEARSSVDLHGAHIGRTVVLVFERGDPYRPIVVGCLRHDRAVNADEIQRLVDIDADGERVIVSAVNQLVLRCGKAKITLTSAGKVLIEGTYLLSRSAGVNRIKGGSVQIN